MAWSSWGWWDTANVKSQGFLVSNAQVTPYGFLKTTGEGSTLLFDDFDGGFIDTANRWMEASSGSVTFNQTNSVLNISVDGGSGSFAYLASKPLFLRPGYGFLSFGAGVRLDSGSVQTNCHRFWGFGNTPATPTVSNPVYDGVGFEAVSGSIRAVIFAAGTRIFSANLPVPTDGNLHSYLVQTRADATFWFFDDFSNPSAQATYKNPSNTQLPVLLSLVNDPVSPPVPTASFGVMALGVGDTSCTLQRVSDGKFPWRTAAVDEQGNLRVTQATDADAYGSAISMPRVCQVAAEFDLPLNQNDVSSFLTGTATATTSASLLVLSTGVSGTARGQVNTNKVARYAPARGLYANFSALFTNPTDVNSDQRVGYFDTSNGLFVGYHGTGFGVTIRNAGVDTFVSQSAFNGDLLTGNPSSTEFVAGGSSQALDPTKLNVYRIDFGFLGASPIKFKVLNPDGGWVTFHTYYFPNSSTGPNIQNPSLPITAEVKKSGSDATNLVVKCGSWDAGSVEDARSFNINDFKSRKYVTAQNGNLTGSFNLYSVSPGRTLHVTNLVIGASNANSTPSSASICDTNPGFRLIPFSLQGSTNQANSGLQQNIPFSTVPLKITGSVYVEVQTGVTVAVSVLGYEGEI